MTASGEFVSRRRAQSVAWMREMLQDRLMTALGRDPAVAAALPAIEAEVRDGRLMATLAVERVLTLMGLDQAP